MSDWTAQKERSNSFTLKLICYIALNTSRNIARILLWPITLYFFITSPSIRFSSRHYLKRVTGFNASYWKIICHIHHFSAVILDRVYFITNQFDQFDIDIQNGDYMNDVISSGKGAILLGTHVGSFEVLRCLALSYKHLSLKVLMYQEHNAMMTQILDQLNPDIANLVIDLAKPMALFEMKEAFEQGVLVGMLGDRVLDAEKKIACDFLGEKVNFPAGPFKLAEMLGVPVIGFFGIYIGGNRYEVHHHLLYNGEKITRSQRDNTINQLTQVYVNNIESMVKRYPYNWFNFYDYWKDKS